GGRLARFPGYDRQATVGTVWAMVGGYLRSYRHARWPRPDVAGYYRRFRERPQDRRNERERSKVGRARWALRFGCAWRGLHDARLLHIAGGSSLRPKAGPGPGRCAEDHRPAALR